MNLFLEGANVVGEKKEYLYNFNIKSEKTYIVGNIHLSI